MSIYRGKNRKEFYLASLLYDSIEDRNLSSLESLLSEKAADPNIVLPKQGISPFHLAIGCDSNDFSISATKLILQNRGNPNVRSDDGLTPLHIAAAWGRLEIVKLLLSCGGDPDLSDNNRKTPLHYAFEEGFEECLDVLKAHKQCDKEEKDCNAYNLMLDKILVNNTTTIGEYKIVNEGIPDSILKNDDVSTLPILPETDANEFVINWFNKHMKLELPATDAAFCPVVKSTGSTTTYDSFESSVDESENEVNRRPINTEFITFRKVYTKTRKVSKDNSCGSKSSPKSIEDGSFTKLTSSSEISGIVTLPSSPGEDSGLLGGSQDKHQECSSDYQTCSSGKSSELEKNILVDQSVNLFTSDESGEIAKSEGIGSDTSFVSVSEVYKYIDKDKGIVLYEQRFVKTASSDGSLKSSSFSSSKLSETVDYDSDNLRRELVSHGYNPGPITVTTKRVYLRKLRQLSKCPMIAGDTDNISTPVKKVYSIELEKTLRNSSWYNDVTLYKSLEEQLLREFSTPDPSRKWREGTNKASFTYLLLDPRITNNLPCRASLLTPEQIWSAFVSAVFYVGKGKRNRPYSHLYEAVTLWNQAQYSSDNKKLQHILDIWKQSSGVICLHVFQNVIPVEAYTREAAMISAVRLDNLRNAKVGDFYGVAATWPQKQKRMLGVYLLYKAMMIFLNEGERQLFPADIA